MQFSGSARTTRSSEKSHTGTQILSVVCVVTGDELKFPEPLAELHRELNALGTPSELVAVLNEYSSNAVNALRKLAGQCCSLQVYVIRRRVDYATALMAGVENAVGDWVATIDVEADDHRVIRRLYEAALRDHAEVALSVSVRPKKSILDTAVSGAFHWSFRALNGFNLATEAPSARLLSRSVVNSLLSDDSPLIAFETLTARSGYRRCVVPSIKLSAVRRPLAERVSHRWRTLIGVNAAPLRLANLLSGLGAIGALSYSLYVLVIYLIRNDVVPGWTTLSLMMSGMFMMLAMVLWLLSEYMLMLLNPGSRRPRYEISDEFGGRVRSPDDVLNVETEL